MFCHNCGKELKKNANFCTECGAKVKEPLTQPKKTVVDWDPVFEIECEYCKTKFDYKYNDVGYRMWYPDGFVYCPNCKKPLRHSDKNKA